MKSLLKSVKHNMAVVFFKVNRWSCDYLPKEVGDKFVLIGFPHNTNKDGPLGVAYSFYNRKRISPMMKKELFVWPFSVFFNLMGFISIDRSSKHNVVDQIADEFSKKEKFIPAIMPEGTRSDVKSIKTGFWNIAKKADVPIVLLYKDHKQRRLRILAHIKTSDSIIDDLLKIEDIYKKEGYQIPVEETIQRLKNKISEKK